MAPPRRTAELDAAFDTSDDADVIADAPPTRRSPSDGPPGYDTAVATTPTATSQSQSQSNSTTADDVFFDAGDAMPEQPAQPPRRIDTDPLGVTGGRGGDDSDDDDDDGPLSETARLDPRSANTTPHRSGGYNFEQPSYFNTSRSRSASSTGGPATPPGSGGGASLGLNAQASSSRLALDSNAAAGPSSFHATHAANAGGLARARLLLGRFGRFVGMRVPGAAYSSLAQDDGSGGNAGSSRPRRVMGGGLGTDGVFANLNAKPESRRRRAATGGDPDDRGDDDDLVDDVLPPTYEVAAADAAPGYWETTIAPGGLGWTPGGAHVGDVEDLILEGLPIGNFFGFAWNLLVSMCFQFVGFLLTYLLHTTHAARCGSRAGLGITLIQYGFYLRSRALQLAEDGNGADGGVGGGGDGGATGNVNPNPLGDYEPHTVEWGGATLVYGGASSPSSATLSARLDDAVSASAAPGHLATALASDGDNMPAASPGADGTTASSEWLAYVLMVIGYFILLSSLLSYFRVHRWGRALVAASRREQESTRIAENGGQAPEAGAGGDADGSGAGGANPPVGFIHRLRAMMRPPMSVPIDLLRADGRRTGTGEDWIIYPGSRSAAAGASASAGTGTGTPGIRIWGAAPRAGSLAFPVSSGEGGNDSDSESEDGDPEHGAGRRLVGGGDHEHLSPEERLRIGEGSSDPLEQRLIEDMRRVGLL